MTDPKYAAFTALDPFFEIVQQGLAGLVDGDHYFDTIADDAEFEFRYLSSGWPETVRGRDALMALYAGYGNNIVLHGADELVVHRSQDPRVVIIEYDVHGKIVRTGASYDNRFISVVTIEGRKIVHWRRRSYFRCGVFARHLMSLSYAAALGGRAILRGRTPATRY